MDPQTAKLAGATVRFEVRASGCVGSYRVVGDNRAFTASSPLVLERTYASAGAKEERASVQALDSNGQAISSVDTNAVQFQILSEGLPPGGGPGFPPPPPAALTCQLVRLLPVRNGDPMLFQLSVSGPVLSATINGQPAQIGTPFPVLPNQGMYSALAQVQGVSGQANCQLSVQVPTCSLRTVAVSPTDADMEVTFVGPVQSAVSDGLTLTLPAPPAITTFFTKGLAGPGTHTIRVEAQSPAGDTGVCEKSVEAPYLISSSRGKLTAEESEAGLAHDGDTDSYWTSGIPPGFYGVWMYLDLGAAVEISKMRLAPKQATEGISTHVISVGTEPIGRGVAGGNGDIVATASSHTRDGEFFEVTFFRRPVRYIHIWTTQTPNQSHVGWRELEVYR